jgi:uncharacterized protein with HEPN domain
MSDPTLMRDLVEEMIEATEKILRRCGRVGCADDFLADEEGMILLDSICMQLVALGEAVKKLDTLMGGELSRRYPQVPWRSVAGMRDILSHHYFDLNAETVYGVCRDEIENLRQTLERIRHDVAKEIMDNE